MVSAVTYSLLLRQWCSAVFRYAVVTLRADADPAAALKGAIRRPKVNHSKPMPIETIGDFKARLPKSGLNAPECSDAKLVEFVACWCWY